MPETPGPAADLIEHAAGGLPEQSDGYRHIAELAIAYVNEPEDTDTDRVTQLYHELEAAVRHMQVVDARAAGTETKPTATPHTAAWIVPKIQHDENRAVGPRIHGGWIHRAAGQSDPGHTRYYAALLLAAADEAERRMAEGNRA